MSAEGWIARTRAAWWLRECVHVGEQPRLRRQPYIRGAEGAIRIGDRFTLSSSPVTSHLVVGSQALLDIGADVSIAHGAAIAAFERVTIGDGTAIGPFVIIMDTNFHSVSSAQSVVHDCRPVSIGKRCRIGSRVTITRGATIGDDAQILAGAVVSSDIPAGACAGGARAGVLGPAGEGTRRWEEPACLLQEMIARVFRLDTVPDLDAPPSSLPGWSHGSARVLAAALEQQCGIALRVPEMLETRHLRDIAVGMAERIGRRHTKRSE
jgi:acetyltransferase-like isoleucine patch superfamily enzyme